MSREVSFRAVWLVFTLLAIAGGVQGGRASADGIASGSAPASVADSRNVQPTSAPSPASAAQLSTALPAAYEISIRTSGKLPPVQVVPPFTPPRGSRDGAFDLPVFHSAALVGAGSAHVHAGRLARFGSISSFGTSLPPPVIA